MKYRFECSPCFPIESERTVRIIKTVTAPDDSPIPKMAAFIAAIRARYPFKLVRTRRP
jgi:hypothetical protein